MFEEIEQIEWAHPWYDAVRPAFDSLEPAAGPADHFIDRFNANAARLQLQNHRGQPVRFVPQAALPPNTAYEEFIGATGCVPTRENLHDFFNGLVWQTFPLIKRELNALQAAQIAAAGIRQSRGPARDAATIFDENAALLVVRDTGDGRALVEGLRAHRWHDMLYLRRAVFERDAEAWLFGHALMEKLVTPRKAVTAHVLLPPPGADGLSVLDDRALAHSLDADYLVQKPFVPLPVLGVPGWWPQQDQAFYLDHTVFRPKRPAKELT